MNDLRFLFNEYNNEEYYLPNPEVTIVEVDKAPWRYNVQTALLGLSIFTSIASSVLYLVRKYWIRRNQNRSRAEPSVNELQIQS